MREMEEKMNKHEFNLSGHVWGINRSHKIYLKHFADEVGITLGQYPYLVALSYDENLNQDDIEMNISTYSQTDLFKFIEENVKIKYLFFIRLNG